MLNETDYYALYFAKQKSDELRSFFENGEIRKKTSGNTVIAHILEGAGNALVATGNKLLRIA